MKKPGKVIIFNSIIWGLVLIGCSLALRGTGAYNKIWLILAGGAVISTSFIEKVLLENKRQALNNGAVNPEHQAAGDTAESNFSKEKTKKLGVMLIVNAVIWGLVIIGCSLALKDSGGYIEIQTILAGGSILSLFLLMRFSKKLKANLGLQV